MQAPLYQEYQIQPRKPEKAHAGLWFERFFNLYNADWTLENEDKKNWIKQVTGLIGDSQKLERHLQRQITLITQLHGNSQRYTSDWHFITGMGNNHPVENGFSWHPTLAVPYLAGASVKGLIRAWVELNDEGLDPQAQESRLKSWFGTASKEDIAEQSGDFIFFDALPDKPANLICDIMTPHMGKWYSEGGNSEGDKGVNKPDTLPADWHEPVPIPFLAVGKTSLVFHIAPRKVKYQQELTQVFEALTNALDYLGAGAKTAAGYGYFSEDLDFAADLKQQQKQQQEQKEKERTLNAQLANVSSVAKTYFRQADAGNWEQAKDQFLQNSYIEDWLSMIENTADDDILENLIYLLDKHISGLLADPDKVKGKKEKRVYNERQRNIAHRIEQLKAK